jgi:hypothetical protein
VIVCGRIGCVERKANTDTDWQVCVTCCGGEVCPNCVAKGISKSGCLCEFDSEELETQPKKLEREPSGVKIEVEGGIVRDVDVELKCQKCGAFVYDEKGYVLDDKDL